MRLYHELAWLWPIISPPEEYTVEAAQWLEIIRRRLDEDADTDADTGRDRDAGGGGALPTLLDLGCGGGHMLSHLAPHFITEAVDLSPQMLELSRRLNPQTWHHQGDLRSIRLGRDFDVVAIHDAVNYMLTEADLAAAIATATAHLNPGGLLLLAPDWLRDNFAGPRVIDWTRQNRELDVTFIEYIADPDPSDTTVESVFLFIINRDGRIVVEQDRHISGLFPEATWRRLLAAAGFATELVATEGYAGGFGETLFVCRRAGARP